MPRQPRYFVPGLPQHVLIRGVDRQATFFSADDYELFLDALRLNARRYACDVHAYVLMTNHVHLLLTPKVGDSIPRLIQGMGREYVQAINRRYSRTGTLWEGRYKSCLVDADVYLLACQRYIELNPVRAGMVPDPAAYPYSSYRANALGKRDVLIEPHATFRLLGKTPVERRAAYRQLFAESLDRQVVDRIRDITNASQVLGNDRFIDQVETMLGRRVRPKKRGRPKVKPGD